MRPKIIDTLAIALGAATTFVIYGYRFGQGNHTIYLLDALRRTHSDLLAHDWFTTHTLQYHAVFGWLAAALMRCHVIEPAFAIIYVLLVILFHVAWLGIVKQLGFGRDAYVASVALYYLSAAGTGLGMYQFFQDSSVLPSNIANVAMFCAIYFWISRSLIASGMCFGVAGLFHLNHAVVGIVAWIFLCIVAGRENRSRISIASLLAIAPSFINILLAMRAKLSRAGAMPLGEFVDLYVRLRHPHHYDPRTWPIGLWIAFAWMLPFAMLFFHQHRDEAARRVRQIFLFMLGLQLIALIGAGIWYLNESLIQMSLYRFSIFAQLIGCIAVTAMIPRRGNAILGPAGCAAMIGICAVRGPFFGAFAMPRDDDDYLAVCDWAREHTPAGAIFLVPPGEMSFRWRGQRAIVVDYKAVPQLSGELRDWAYRLQRVLALKDLRTLPHGYRQTLAAVDQRYASLSQDQLEAAAREFHARYVVAAKRLEHASPLFASPDHRYFVYDLGEKEESNGRSGNPPPANGAIRDSRRAGDE